MINTTRNNALITRLVLLTLAATLFIQHRAWAGEFTIHVPGEISTIQQAINVAGPTDFEIIVAPGTYNEAIDTLSKSIHLRSSDGPGVTTIDAGGLNSSAITVTNADSASPATIIEGFTITGGDAGQGGGMFIQGAGPTVVDCIFVNNSAALGGGAIYTDSANPTITGCTFELNSAPSGGAIRSSNGLVTVTSSIFLFNTANHGGAMHISSGSDAHIDGCTFKNNKAVEIGDLVGLVGGAILIEGSPGTTSAEIVDTEFRGNTAPIGGGIANFTDGFYVLNTHFESNDAGNGGGVFHNSDFGVINGSTFAHNTADASGGGIFIAPESDPINLGGNFFCANQPDHVSGPSNQHQNEFSESCDVTYHVPDDYPTIQQAINASANGTLIIVAPGTYNEALDTAGLAIHLQSSAGPGRTIINVGGMGTSAITIANGEGPDTIIEGFTFTGGQTQYGGGMYVNGADPTVINCHFIDNSATYGGGVAILDSGMSFAVDMFVTNNSAEQGGGVFVQNSAVNFAVDMFISNNSAEQGGGMFIDSGSVAFPSETFIFENNAATVGGGIAIINGGSVAFPSETFILQGNTANIGGGLAVFDGIATLSGEVTFQGNSAAEFGGGAAIFDGGGIEFTSGVLVLDGNSAGIGGGLAIKNTSEAFPSETFITGNSADVGGGLAVMDGATVAFPSETFINANTATFGGGVVVMDGGSVEFPSETFITGNSAVIGGGIVIESGGGLAIKRPEDIGGGVSFPSEVIAFIQNNTADFGGGLFNNGDADIEDALFENNQADVGGGVYNNAGGSILIGFGSFTGNSATGIDLVADGDGPGGAIFTAEGSTTEIGDTFFCQNTPDNFAGPWIDLGGNQLNPVADLNCDGVVNVSDLLMLLGQWGTCADPNDCPADLNDDGVVNVSDLLILLGNWG